MTKTEAIKAARAEYPGQRITTERFHAGIRGEHFIVFADGESVGHGVGSWASAIINLRERKSEVTR